MLCCICKEEQRRVNCKYSWFFPHTCGVSTDQTSGVAVNFSDDEMSEYGRSEEYGPLASALLPTSAKISELPSVNVNELPPIPAASPALDSSSTLTAVSTDLLPATMPLPSLSDDSLSTEILDSDNSAETASPLSACQSLFFYS